jgi:hypothetical protein
MRQTATLETITVIAIFRQDRKLFKNFLQELRNYNFTISRHGRDALKHVGFDTIAEHPLPWLWDLLFSLNIFKLPEQKQTLQVLTYHALDAKDDRTAIALLRLLRKKGLIIITITTLRFLLESNGKEKNSYRFMKAVLSNTTLDVIDDSQALLVASKAGNLGYLWLLLRRGAYPNHIRAHENWGCLQCYTERAEPYEREPEGTALHGLAGSDRNFVAIWLLLWNGADAWVTNEMEELPIEEAKRNMAACNIVLLTVWMLVGWLVPCWIWKPRWYRP